MRELIQSDYATMAKSVGSAKYNRTQIQLYVLDKDVRGLSDSMDYQKEQFATLSAANSITTRIDNTKEKTEEDYIRKREPVESENEREKQKHEPKVWSNLVIDKPKDLSFDITRDGKR